MRLFRKHRAAQELPHFDPEAFEPVIRASICTGERVACMREKDTGKLHELMLLGTEEDLERFCRDYGLEQKDIRTVY